jgi:hypothetical protein
MEYGRLKRRMTLSLGAYKVFSCGDGQLSARKQDEPIFKG